MLRLFNTVLRCNVSKPFIAILMGSDSDLPVMRTSYQVLMDLGISAEMRVLSAHRTPSATHEYVRDADERGCVAFICAAGLAAHLAGAVASTTTKPVIGVPLDAGSLQGMDALLSTVQMPGGIPVACVAIGKPGAKNAAYLAAQIIALQAPELAARLKEERRANRDKILVKNEALQAELQQV